ncbi:hypothetical protein [Lutibacter citreus]|uniref:hypothetical protein n=1 Tax=Lutibacter citreus TaxID=2138210 RepID=UPI000DBEA95C|nr:hypothetical protein [Lutibacter citreus]
MRKYFYIFILAFFFIPSTYSQQIKNDSLKLELIKIALINQSDSYVTFPTDIGAIAPLLFEANVSPSFVIKKRKDSRLMGVFTPQIIIRMYNEYSYPVRTPSYIPQLTFYYLTGNKQASKKLTLFGRIAHHSNGQDGNFFNEDGNINLNTGSFSTNFIELGFINSSFSKSLNAFNFFKSSIELHPKNWMIRNLHGVYSGFRWKNTFQAIKLPFPNLISEKRPAISLKLETTWMFDAINNLDTFNINRLNASLTIYYHPKFLEDIGLFVQFYHGNDYYNINFQNRLDIIRFGLMTEILRF